jgi:hypothetical protein
MNTFSRRSFGVSSAAGAVVGLLGKAADAAAPSAADARTQTSAGTDMPAWLIAPLRRGSDIGSGWTIAETAGIVRGAFVLELGHVSGRRVELHLCRLDGAATGIACSKHLDFFLMNGGDGGVPSDEELGLVVISLARRVSDNEERRGATALPPANVLSHAARLAQYHCV